MIFYLAFIFVYVLLTKEYIILNEEFLVIVSFLLVLFLVFSNVSGMLGTALDMEAKEMGRSFKVFSQRKIQILQEQKNIFTGMLASKKAYIESASFLLFCFANLKKDVDNFILNRISFHYFFLLFSFKMIEKELKLGFFKKSVQSFLYFLQADSEFFNEFACILEEHFSKGTLFNFELNLLLSET